MHAKRWGRRTWAEGYSGSRPIIATARRLFHSNPGKHYSMKWSDASGDLKRSDKVQSISENSFRPTISSNVGARVCLTSHEVLSFLYILLAHINLFENSYSVFQYILCRTKSTTKVTSCHRHEARTGLNVIANSSACTCYHDAADSSVRPRPRVLGSNIAPALISRQTDAHKSPPPWPGLHQICPSARLTAPTIDLTVRAAYRACD